MNSRNALLIVGAQMYRPTSHLTVYCTVVILYSKVEGVFRLKGLRFSKSLNQSKIKSVIGWFSHIFVHVACFNGESRKPSASAFL